MVIQQIWLGPKPMPVKWMDSWRLKNPGLKHQIWRGYQGFHYRKKIQHLVEQGRYAIAADIMRVEILYRYGGIYIDADSVCLQPVEDAPFIDDDFWAVYDYTGWVANGVIGCTPRHPVMKRYMELIAGPHHYWEYGARMLTECLDGTETILPTCTFYPTNWKGNKAPAVDKVYAEQYWATTRGKYA
jgi:mannosyltransferase OCH1-like enzyme